MKIEKEIIEEFAKILYEEEHKLLEIIKNNEFKYKLGSDHNNYCCLNNRGKKIAKGTVARFKHAVINRLEEIGRSLESEVDGKPI